jgi:hypothetical protein
LRSGLLLRRLSGDPERDRTRRGCVNLDFCRRVGSDLR